MSSNKYKIIFLSLILIGLSFAVLSVSAAELKYQFPCSPIAGGTCPTAEQTAQSPAAYIARFYQFALMISGALAFGMIIFGAIQYIVSAGNATTQKDAADRIFQALWGIALLFGAYLILYTIDPKLVSLTDPKIDILKVPTAPTTGIGSGYAEYKWTQAVYQDQGNGNGQYLCPEGSTQVDPSKCGGVATSDALSFCCASGKQAKTTAIPPGQPTSAPTTKEIAPGVTEVAPGVIEATGNGGTYQYQYATDATFKDLQKDGWQSTDAISSGICEQIPSGKVLSNTNNAFCVSKTIK